MSLRDKFDGNMTGATLLIIVATFGFFHLKFALKLTHPPAFGKNADLDRFPLITSQPYIRASEKEFNYYESEIGHAGAF